MLIDHILVSVPALGLAVDDFTRAGFRVYYGTAQDKAYNAMVYFEDGTFIELVDTSAFPRILSLLHQVGITRLFGAMATRAGHYACNKKRILDIALHAPDIQAEHSRLKQCMRVSKIHALKRLDMNATRLSWQLFAPKDIDLPFVMSVYHPARLPEAHACKHANGIRGIYQIVYRVAQSHAASYLGRLATMLQRSPDRQGNGDALFSLHSYTLLVSPHQEEALVLQAVNDVFDGRHLAKYGVTLLPV